MERLTGSKTAATLKENAEKLQAAGFGVDMSNLRYIRLAEYEETGLTVDDILYMLADRKKLIEELKYAHNCIRELKKRVKTNESND